MTSGRAFRSLRTQGEALARLRYDFWQLFGTRWYRTTTQYIYSKDYAHAHASVALEMECCRRGSFSFLIVVDVIPHCVGVGVAGVGQILLPLTPLVK